MSQRWNCFDDDGRRVAAMRRRERGGSIREIKVSAYAPVERESWGHAFAVAQAYWRSARTDAHEQFRFDVYGDQWEGLAA